MMQYKYPETKPAPQIVWGFWVNCARKGAQTLEGRLIKFFSGVISLFRSQTFYRVYHRCFYGLKAQCEQCNNNHCSTTE